MVEIPGLAFTLGEGPHWDIESQTLYFIDILGDQVYRYIPNEKILFSINAPNPGCAIPHVKGGMIIASLNGIEYYGDELKTLKEFNKFENKPLNRFNDGKVDPFGRFWVGTMAKDCKGTEGTLYSINTNLEHTAQKTNIGISNGLAWSSDNKTMYYIDSPTKKVVAFDYSLETGKIDNERTVIENFTAEGEVPDGMTIDSEGFLWVAIWGGSRVIRVDVKTGKEVQRISVPAKNITSCAFGGPQLDILYITTASFDTSLEEFPLAGKLFSIKPGATGLPMKKFDCVL